MLIMMLAASAEAAETNADSIDAPAPDRVIVVVGAPGTDEYGELFAQWAERLRGVAGRAEAELVSIGGKHGSNGKSEPSNSASNDRESLQQALQASQEQTSSPLWIFLIGHGTFYEQTAKFNLRGPDVSAAELSQWLAPIDRPVVLVNCASASGPFINRLSSPGRVIVTATQSGSEHNFARFGDYFSGALGDVASDLDHDDQVSVLEAFLRASREVRGFYEAESRLSTEHALVDDNGDRRGTPATMYEGTRPSGQAKDGAEIDGNRARRLTLAPASVKLPLTEDELARRRAIEGQLDELRARKSELDPQAYDEQLEPLLLELARLYREAERRQESD